jgi:hypothetical protein
MKTSEDRVQKLISRALEKLRAHFARCGITLTTTAICRATAAHSVQAAPAGMASATASTALGTSAATGGSALALVKATLNLMSWMKLKSALGLTAAILLAGSGNAAAVWGAVRALPWLILT